MNTQSVAAIPTRRTFNWLLVRIAIGLAGVILITFASLPSTRRLLANPTGETPAVGVNQIAVRGDAFQNHRYTPAVVQVPVGTTVIWRFDDRGTSGTGTPVKHNVVGRVFASPVLASGSFSHTFTQPGTYRYTCTLHTYMDGQIEVVAR